MPTFPPDMPAPSWYQIVEGPPVGAVLRTDMDAGPAKQRLRFSAAPNTLDLTFRPVTDDQRQVFVSWYKFELGLGALAFTMKHPMDEVDIVARFIANDAPYTIKPVGVKVFEIQTRMEVLP